MKTAVLHPVVHSSVSAAHRDRKTREEPGPGQGEHSFENDIKLMSINVSLLHLRVDG